MLCNSISFGNRAYDDVLVRYPSNDKIKDMINAPYLTQIKYKVQELLKGDFVLAGIRFIFN